MDKLIKDIVQEKHTCLFVSPHYDDAVFSAGGLMLELLNRGAEVFVVNVFTNGGTNNTMSAKMFLRQTGYKNGINLYKQRTKEDAQALHVLGSKYINLGHTDALWRQKPTNSVGKYISRYIPELSAVYPTYRFHISKGIVSRLDNGLLEKITTELHNLISKQKKCIVFGPLGVGYHVDHILVRKALENLNIRKIYWADYPYMLDNKIEDSGFKKLTFEPNWIEKEKVMRQYKSQFSAIFGNKVGKKKSEIYYI